MGNTSKNKKGPKPPTAAEIKTFIMCAQHKLTWYRNKKVATIKKKREEIGRSWKENNWDVAKAKMDSLIREEDMITAFDILGPMCEILREKVTYLLSTNICPPDLRAQLDSMIFSSSRMEVEELHKLRELVKLQYGQLYLEKADNNTDGLVNVNLVEKLRIKPCSDAIITIRLKQLCKEDKIEFDFPNEIVFSPGYAGEGDGGAQINPYGSTLDCQNYQQGGFNPNQNMGNYNNYGGNNAGGEAFGGFGDGNYNNYNNYNDYTNNNNNQFGNWNQNDNMNPYSQQPMDMGMNKNNFNPYESKGPMNMSQMNRNTNMNQSRINQPQNPSQMNMNQSRMNAPQMQSQVNSSQMNMNQSRMNAPQMQSQVNSSQMNMNQSRMNPPQNQSQMGQIGTNNPYKSQLDVSKEIGNTNQVNTAMKQSQTNNSMMPETSNQMKQSASPNSYLERNPYDGSVIKSKVETNENMKQSNINPYGGGMGGINNDSMKQSNINPYGGGMSGINNDSMKQSNINPYGGGMSGINNVANNPYAMDDFSGGNKESQLGAGQGYNQFPQTGADVFPQEGDAFPQANQKIPNDANDVFPQAGGGFPEGGLDEGFPQDGGFP